MTTRLGINISMFHDHPYLSTCAGSILLAGHAAMGEAISVYQMIFPSMGGALFGGFFVVGGVMAWAIDYITDATSCFGDSNLAQITRAALYAIFGAAVAAAVVSLAGFSIVIVDAAQLAGLMTLADASIMADIMSENRQR